MGICAKFLQENVISNIQEVKKNVWFYFKYSEFIHYRMKKQRAEKMIEELMFEKRTKNAGFMAPESLLVQLDELVPKNWSRSDLMIRYIAEGIQRDKRKREKIKK